MAIAKREQGLKSLKYCEYVNVIRQSAGRWPQNAHCTSINEMPLNRKESSMRTKIKLPREYRIPVSQDMIRNINDPYHINWLGDSAVSVIHALVRMQDFPSGEIPDKINPRSHVEIRHNSKIPRAIKETLEYEPERFHLLNRGCLIIARRAFYNNQSKILHFLIESDDEHGMVDGATTDKVIAGLKDQISDADFASLTDDEIPSYIKRAYLHVEIISGYIEQDLRIKLADARNTSLPVKEFSLENLKGNFDWLREIIDKSEFRGRIRYRENDPEDVDIRTILALLTLFHPRWLTMNKDPNVAYTGKGAVLDIYTDSESSGGYRQLAPLVIDILKLYDYIHIGFQPAYVAALNGEGKRAKFGNLTGVKYIHNPQKAKILPLTQKVTQYVIADGWVYPILAAFRMLVAWPKKGRGQAKWHTDPFQFFDRFGPELVNSIVEKSQELGRNPNAIGKSKEVWSSLRITVENYLLRERIVQLERK